MDPFIRTVCQCFTTACVHSNWSRQKASCRWETARCLC